jgi:hypothetical protein
VLKTSVFSLARVYNYIMTLLPLLSDGDLQQLPPIRGDQLNATPLGDCIIEEALAPPPGAGRQPMRRSRSAVWKHFTKMHKKKDVQDVYAACLRCDGMLKAHSKDSGTSQLWRHYKMHQRAATLAYMARPRAA